MAVTTDDIISGVRIILDHNDVTSSIASLTDVDTLNLDDIIYQHIVPCARLVELVCPEDMVDWTSVTGGTLDNTENIYTLPLPDGYIRFGRCKLSNWVYGVSEPVDTGSREFIRQFGEFDALKASSSRPLAAIVNGDASTYGNTLLMFGTDEDTTLDYCSVLVEPSISDSSINVGTELYQPLLFCVAAHTAETLKDSSKANQMMTTMYNMLGHAKQEQTTQDNTNQ